MDEKSIFVAFLIFVFVCIFFMLFLIPLLTRKKAKKQHQEQLRKDWERLLAQDKNPIKVFLPKERELIDFSMGCHGLVIVTKVVERQPEYKELALCNPFRNPENDNVGILRSIIIIQGGEFGPFENEKEISHFVLPPQVKLIGVEIGCRLNFLTRQAEPDETPDRFEYFSVKTWGDGSSLPTLVGDITETI